MSLKLKGCIALPDCALPEICTDSTLKKLRYTLVREEIDSLDSALKRYIFVDSNISCLNPQSTSMSLRELQLPSPFPLIPFAPCHSSPPKGP